MNHSNAEFALLPPELWVHIFSYLPKHDLNQALQACKAFSSISKDSWKAVCYRRWHGYATLANHSHSTRWEQTFDLLSMREQEKGFVADVNAIWDFQSEINASHRAILVEWLFEVGFAWSLDSSIVFDSVRYVDCYLSKEVAQKSSFQLMGLACLRAALVKFRGSNPMMPPIDSLMDPNIYSYFSAGACTSEEVVEKTRNILDMVPETQKTLPNARMYLRSLWYQACFHNTIQSHDMHIYSLAAFIQELGIIHFPCAAYPPSILASSALSLSLLFYGRAPWPSQLESFICYTQDDILQCMVELAIAQQRQQSSTFRRMWRKTYLVDSVQECDAQKNFLQLVIHPSNILVTLIEEFTSKLIAMNETRRTNPRRTLDDGDGDWKATLGRGEHACGNGSASRSSSSRSEGSPRSITENILYANLFLMDSDDTLDDTMDTTTTVIHNGDIDDVASLDGLGDVMLD